MSAAGGFRHHAWVARYALLNGLGYTIELSLIVIIIGTAIGGLGGACLKYGALPLRFPVRAYVDGLRGIPVLVLIFASFYGLALLGLDISAFLGGVVALSAFCGAHMSETIRGAIDPIPTGQTEAAQAIGLRPWQRLWYVVLPQAVRCILPLWVNTAVEMVKASTLLSVIGVVELLLATQQVISHLHGDPLLSHGGRDLFNAQLRHLAARRRARAPLRLPQILIMNESAMPPIAAHKTAQTAPVLRAHNVHKRFGATEVLKGIDLEVQEGEVVAMIGASGSGKTTSLRCVNLLEEYDEGEISVGGETIGCRTEGGRRRRLGEPAISTQRARNGMEFQSFNLFPHMTALENVMLGLTKVQGRARAEAEELASRWLSRVGLADRQSHYPFQLSGGQQQRVAIARATAMEPQLILFDEVTSALDPELVVEVLAVMQDLARSGMTMLVVSHELMFVRDVASRVVFMDGGRIQEQGTPEELLYQRKSERLAAFLGRFHGLFG